MTSTCHAEPRPNEYLGGVRRCAGRAAAAERRRVPGGGRVLTERQIRHALYCAAEELRARQAGKPPGPAPWNHDLLRALKHELALTHSRRAKPESETQSTHDDHEIGTAQAAQLLGWPRRRVQRRAFELGGRPVAGRFLFDRNDIEQLAAEEGSGDRT
jgi:uncharacterized membrane protein YccC